ncbi:hypothetical protein MP213Fo_10660 [Pseudochrobactrum sp. MP213Fo]
MVAGTVLRLVYVTGIFYIEQFALWSLEIRSAYRRFMA